MKQTVIKSHKDRGNRKATDGRFLKESATSAFLDQVFTKVKPASTTPKQEATPAQAPKAGTAGDPITLLIAQNPEMNASTFFNLLKSKGFVISPPAQSLVDEKKESDTASANVAALRAGVKENKRVGFKTRTFLESQVNVKDNKAGSTRYKVVLLEEGMGNFGAGCYYSKQALQSGIPIFEGRKIYADHPAESEAEERPERSVRDILGYFENVHLEESKAGRSLLCGDVVVMGGPTYQWARELMEAAVDYQKKFPDKEFVGLSINASGDSEEVAMEEAMRRGIPEEALPKIQEAKKEGITTLTYVTNFKEAVSCDLVTEAGAGGKILNLVEGARKMTEAEKKEKEAKEAAAKKEAEAKKEADGNTGDDQGGGDHKDAAQDIALIKQMMAKYMGGDAVADEEAAIVKEAYEAHKEMGLKDDEAGSKACEYLKASKHMAAKREAAAQQEAAKAASAGSASGADDKKDEQTESKGEESKESGAQKESSVKESAGKGKEKSELEKLREDNARLLGENASFRESEKKKAAQAAVSGHIEKLCKESKLTKEVTSSFKKLVETAKSVEEVDKTWAVFQEGYRSKKAAAEGGLSFGDMVIDVEKTTFTESAQGSGVNLSACVNED